MTTYEQDCEWAQDCGIIPKGVHYTNDNAGWERARCADTVLLRRLRKLIAASPFISIPIDDSDDSSKQEQCCIIILLLGYGWRVPHLLKMHALPGACTDAESITDEIIAVLCGVTPGQTLHEEGYGVAGLSR